MKFGRLIKAIGVGLCGCVILSLCGFAAQCEDISDRVLRLHILAASDSDEDQAVKLKVRDAILAQTDGLLDSVNTTAAAQEKLNRVLPRIEAIAREELRRNGSNDDVKAELCKMHFDTRVYESVTMPAGVYTALRVTIGEGAGHNWWCVVFPPMCLSSVCEQEMGDVLSESQTDIVTNPSRYQVRFKVVEWYHQLRDWIES